jgi:hypothetical protein
LEKVKKDDKPSPATYLKAKDAYINSTFDKEKNYTQPKYKEKSFIEKNVK